MSRSGMYPEFSPAFTVFFYVALMLKEHDAHELSYQVCQLETTNNPGILIDKDFTR